MIYKRLGDWGLGIGDWGLGIGPNPQSPIPIPIENILIKKFLINLFFIFANIYLSLNNDNI